MNYFEFYGIPEVFHVDEAAVKRKFYQLSKEYHPDFYINASAEKQQEILELSTVNTKAFQILSNSKKRVEHILQLNNQIAEGDKYQLPQSFLMEMMEVNETLMELEFEPDEQVLVNTLKQVDSIEDELNVELNSLTKLYDKEENSSQKELFLLKIKDLYYRQKYLLRIRESLNTFAHR